MLGVALAPSPAEAAGADVYRSHDEAIFEDGCILSDYTIITTPSSNGYYTYVVRVDSDYAIYTEDGSIYGERSEVSSGRFTGFFDEVRRTSITRDVTTSTAGIRCATRLTWV